MSKPFSLQAIIAQELGEAAASTLESFLVNQLKDEIQTEFGILEGAVTIDLFKPNGVSIHWSEENQKWEVRCNMEVSGQWSPDA